MKTLFCLIFLTFAFPSFAQKIIKHKAPKGVEGAGSFSEVRLYKDTLQTITWNADSSLYDDRIITSSDFEADGDTAIYISKNIIYGLSGRVSLGKFDYPIKPSDKSYPIRQWQIAIIKEKFPDYYNKWFKKK